MIVLVVLLVFSIVHYSKIYSTTWEEYFVLCLTLLLFGIIGLFDDMKKVFKFKGLALRVRHKFLIQIIIAGLIAFFGIKYRLFLILIPIPNAPLVITNMLLWFALSIFTIVFMSNAFNIIDGIDGLSAGSLLMTLMTLAVLVLGMTNSLTQLVFIFILFGAVLAFLYFNVNPARLFMGDTGALAFGAILGVLTLMTGTFVLLPIYGIVYIVDAISSLVQWTSKYFRNGKKVFKIAPLHHHFEALGWDGTKVVFRFWIIHAFFSMLALGLMFVVF